MKRVLRHAAAACSAIAVGGCGPHPQSVLDPRSPEASEIALLWWIMFGMCAAVFVLVLWLMIHAIVARPGTRAPGGSRRFVVVLGIILPTVVLLYFLIHSLRLSVLIRPPEDGLTIEVTGYQWWWDVRYPEEAIVIANEVHIPAGERVRLRLRSADVIHSFWVPNLHGKLDMMPEVETEIWIQADEPGVWRGQCAEFCGTQHALMGFEVIAHAPEEFERWVAQRQLALEALQESGRTSYGHDLFVRHGCYSCHAIAGTEAESNVGPDLTHVGSRRMIGAAAIPNNFGNLAGWIADPQGIKPGNLMPATYMEPEELHALVEYLLTLQ